jgi:hypothetical protein
MKGSVWCQVRRELFCRPRPPPGTVPMTMGLGKRKGLIAIVASMVLSFLIPLGPVRLVAQEAQYQGQIRWAGNDSGAPDRPRYYLAFPELAWCLAAGNHSCATSVAIEAEARSAE